MEVEFDEELDGEQCLCPAVPERVKVFCRGQSSGSDSERPHRDGQT